MSKSKFSKAFAALKGYEAPAARYDESNTKKVGIGVFVVLANGRQYLFGETATWTWRTIGGVLMVQVKENGAISLHAPASAVACVGGPQVIFRDAEWK